VARIVGERKKEEERNKRKASGLSADSPPLKKRRGRKPKLSGEDILELLDWIEEDSGLRIKDIRTRLAERGITISKASICKYLSKLDISYKLVLPIPDRWNADPVVKARREYVLNFIALSSHCKVFIDESSFNLHVRRRKGWSLRGEPAKLSLLPKGGNTSLIASLFPTGIGMHKFVDSCPKKPGVRSEDFIIYLNELCVQLPDKVVIIFDNAKIHHTEEVNRFLDTLKKGRGIQVLYLPPYSPFLNPIEYVFAKIKQVVGRSEFRTRQRTQGSSRAGISFDHSTRCARMDQPFREVFWPVSYMSTILWKASLPRVS
jgi:transposase